ncbi:MAG: DUF3179 domain-containing protein [Kiloniellales bacterium]|nr:DUF3179 domain-containing protein [Kiloniellales bacterium]
MRFTPLKSLLPNATGLWFAVLLAAAPFPAGALTDGEIARHSDDLVFGSRDELLAALEAFEARGERDIAPALILALRYAGTAKAEIAATLRALTGHEAESWFDWMLWQQAHPEVAPHPSYATLKLKLFATIDPRFLRFLVPWASQPETMRIRLEEITWGGVAVDGIPSLDDPELIAAAEADYLREDDLVFGVEINGDARAYPLRIMGWHEMFNETIGGVPVALAYCTLCGAGILFETRVEGRAAPFVFGSSGFLYRSNKLMFDRETDSLWNQFTGEPVVGPLAGSGIKLKIRPVAITSWGRWRARKPETRVLSLDTGHSRDYGSGVVYHDYFASPNLMFPALVDQTRLKQKDYVFGIRSVGAAKAWPVTAFGEGRVINDRVGQQEVVLIGDARTRSVRAYARDGRRFEASVDRGRLSGPGGLWRLEEDALVGPDGTRLPRIPGHIAYWFAWDGYLGVESELYAEDG